MTNREILHAAIREAHVRMQERRWQPTLFPIDDGDVDDSSAKQRARILKLAFEMRDIARRNNVLVAFGPPVVGRWSFERRR